MIRCQISSSLRVVDYYGVGTVGHCTTRSRRYLEVKIPENSAFRSWSFTKEFRDNYTLMSLKFPERLANPPWAYIGPKSTH